MALTQAELDAAQTQINAARDQTHTNIGLAEGWAQIAQDAANASGSASAQVATAEANRAGQQKALAETARTGAETARDRAEDARDRAEDARDRAEAVPDTVDTLVPTLIDDPTSETRSALNATYATKAEAGGGPGANLPRTLAKLRTGEPITIGAIGDSRSDPTTPGNAGGGPVERLAALLETRFGATVTVVNGAVSGATMATQYLRGDVQTVVAAQPDLTVVHIGTNDSNSDAFGPYAPGYVRSASVAAVERATAYLRDAREDAEFVFLGTGPYRSLGSSSNQKQLDYNAELRALAATVGAEWVDGYGAFMAYAAENGNSINALMYDSTHQNAAGNDLYAETMLAHFPEVSPQSVLPALAPRARSGRYGIDTVDKTVGNLGYATAAAPTSTGPLTFALSGTGWTVDGAYDVSSTAGDTITLSANATEFFFNLDIAVQPVVDFVLDGTVVAADVDIHSLSGKNNASYWVAPFLGLDPGQHTVALVVKSGTLRVQSAAALIAASASEGFTPESRVVDLGTVGIAGLPDTGSYADHFSATLYVPDGWNGMSVQFMGAVTYRTTAATTEPRAVQARIEYSPGPFDQYLVAPADTAGSKPLFSTPIAHYVESAFSATVTLRSRVLGSPKTNIGTVSGNLRAILTRTS